jgi:SurA N-terminal domain
MRRSVDVPRTSIKLAAAVLTVGLAVAACGTVKMGAAAIVGDSRISSSTLSAQVSELNASYQADQGKVQLQFAASEMPQQVLSWLVRFRIRDRLAERQHITVTPTDVQQALNSITAQIRQSGNTGTLSEVAVANGLPPDMLTDLGRYQAIETKLLDRLDGGKLPTQTAQQQTLQNQFSASECRAAKSLNIKINPQFGLLDYKNYVVVAAPTTLSKPQPAASASPTPTATQTAPHC